MYPRTMVTKSSIVEVKLEANIWCKISLNEPVNLRSMISAPKTLNKD